MSTGAGNSAGQATEGRLRSPEDLDKQIRVVNTGVWLCMLAAIVVVLLLLLWSVFGSISTSVACMGVVSDGKTICMLSEDAASKVHVGDMARVEDEEEMTIASIGHAPLSRKEMGAILSSDYLVTVLMPADWAYLVTLEGDASAFDEKVPLSVSITTETVAPVSLILGNRV